MERLKGMVKRQGLIRCAFFWMGAKLLVDSSTYSVTTAFVVHSYKKPLDSIGLNSYSIGIGMIAGSDPERPHKQYQDASFTFNCNEYTCWGVMDGHGTKGHVVTMFLKEEIPRILQEKLALLNESGFVATNDDDESALHDFEEKLVTLAKAEPIIHERHSIEQLFTQTFHLAHINMMKNPNVPAGRSGTTCIVCLLDKSLRKLHVASVGDSRAILWNTNDARKDQVIAQETTAAVSTELARIQKCEGRVDGAGNVFYGPVGIAMTRALGDAVMLRAGVIPTPIVNTFQLQDGINRIVVATDGVFDVITNEDVRETVDNALSEPDASVQHAADTLAETANRKWLGDLPIESKVDDITCIVVEC